MKRVLLLLCILISLKINAQLAEGSVAPDFTVEDINGNTHSLSTYLNQGKNVILKFFDTLCMPCLDQHENGDNGLYDLYTAYGPSGSDELVILYIEQLPRTVDDLNGTGPHTFGNFIDGTPYPIIISPEVSNLYSIEGTPQTICICPNGIIDNEGAFFFVLDTGTEYANSCAQFEGLSNFAGLIKAEGQICNNTVGISATLENFGVNHITSGEFKLKKNSNVVATSSFDGDILPFGKQEITFPSITYDPDANYQVEIESINFSTSFSSQNLYDVEFVNTPYIPQNEIEIKVYTDYYPGEMSWNIIGSAGNIVASGGPYDPGDPNIPGSSPDSHTIKTHYATLPDEEDCYSIQFYDEGGNGWTSSGCGIEILTNGESVKRIRVGNFGSYLLEPNIFTTHESSLSINSFKKDKISIYPNPSFGIITFNTPDIVNLAVLDTTGKIVYNQNNISDGDKIDLSQLQKGFYILQIESPTIKTIKKKYYFSSNSVSSK